MLEIGLFAAQLAQVFVQKVLVFLADLGPAVHRRRRRDAIDGGADQPLLLGQCLGQSGVLVALLVQFGSQFRYLKMKVFLHDVGPAVTWVRCFAMNFVRVPLACLGSWEVAE